LWTTSYDNKFNVQIEQLPYNSTTWANVYTSGELGSTWPGHVWLQHNNIPFYNIDGRNKQIRVTITVPTWASTYDFDLGGLNWYGGYPAAADARHKYMSVDENKSVTFTGKTTVEKLGLVNAGISTGLTGNLCYTGTTRYDPTTGTMTTAGITNYPVCTNFGMVLMDAIKRNLVKFDITAGCKVYALDSGTASSGTINYTYNGAAVNLTIQGDLAVKPTGDNMFYSVIMKHYYNDLKQGSGFMVNVDNSDYFYSFDFDGGGTGETAYINRIAFRRIAMVSQIPTVQKNGTKISKINFAVSSIGTTLTITTTA
jgi:hypothetical protein